MKCTVLLLMLVLLGTGVFSQDFSPGSGIIREISGTVELKRSAAAPFVSASVGDQVADDTIISTGLRSAALIEVGSVLITVRPLTRLTFIEIRTSDEVETLNTFLQSGRVRVDVDPPAGTRASMDVISPVSVSSVRGTSFEFDLRNLYVYSGTVNFRGSNGQRVSVNAGINVELGESGRAVSPVVDSSSAFVPPQPAGLEQEARPLSTGIMEEIPGLSFQLTSGDYGFSVNW